MAPYAVLAKFPKAIKLYFNIMPEFSAQLFPTGCFFGSMDFSERLAKGLASPTVFFRGFARYSGNRGNMNCQTKRIYKQFGYKDREPGFRK